MRIPNIEQLFSKNNLRKIVIPVLLSMAITVGLNANKVLAETIKVIVSPGNTVNNILGSFNIPVNDWNVNIFATDNGIVNPNLIYVGDVVTIDTTHYDYSTNTPTPIVTNTPTPGITSTPTPYDTPVYYATPQGAVTNLVVDIQHEELCAYNNDGKLIVCEGLTATFLAAIDSTYSISATFVISK